MSANSSNVGLERPPRSSFIGRLGLAALFTLWAVGVFFVTQILIALVFVGLGEAGLEFEGLNQTVFNTVIAAIAYVVALAVVVGAPWLLWRGRTTLRELGLQRSLEWRDFLLAPLAFVGYIVISLGLVWLATVIIPGFDLEQKQDVGFDSLNARYEYILAFITLVVIAPIAEELLFRGYLYGKVRRQLPMWLTIVLISAAFGAAHLQWNVAVDTFALSVAMCLLREYTGTIWAAVLVHMIKNGIAFFVLFVAPPISLGFLG